jgi:hypothetical protein
MGVQDHETLEGNVHVAITESDEEDDRFVSEDTLEDNAAVTAADGKYGSLLGQ